METRQNSREPASGEREVGTFRPDVGSGKKNDLHHHGVHERH